MHFDHGGGAFPSSHFTFQFSNGHGPEAGPSNGNYDAFFDLNAASDSTPGPSDHKDGRQSDSPQTIQASTPRTEEDAVADWFNINSASSSTTPISQNPSPGFSSGLQSSITDQDTAAFIAQAASSFESNGSSTSAADMESLMNLFYTANASSSTSSPFATINPTQVLGSGPSSGGPSPAGSGGNVLSPDYSSPGHPGSHHNSPHQHPFPQPTSSNSKRPIARPGLIQAPSASSVYRPATANPSKKKQSSSGAPSRSTSSPNLVGMNGMSSLASSGSGALGGPLMSQQQRAGASSQAQQKHRPSSKNSTPATTPKSETTTPEGSGASQNNGETPTVCSNCHTTNTPLWRRDPEGNPLCNVSLVFRAKVLRETEN